VERTVEMDDLIPSARHYLAAVLAELSDYLDRGLMPADEKRLPDGSLWKIG
jgi:hypothetical protein